MTIDPGALLNSLQGADWRWLTAAVLLLPVNLALDGLVWKWLLHSVVDRVSLRDLTGAVLSGFALGFWTPAQVGEYAGRTFYLPEGDRWELSITVFAQRMVDMTVGVIVGLMVLLTAVLRGVLPVTGSWLAAMAVGMGTAIVLVLFVAEPGRAHRLLQGLFENTPSVTDRTAFLAALSPGQGLAVVTGSLLRYVVFIGQMVCLGLALLPSASWIFVTMAACLTFYAKYLIPSLTFLDLGIREGSAAFFFHQMGLGAAAGLNAALMLFALNVLAPAAIGVPFVTGLRLSRPPRNPAETPSKPPLLPGA